VHGSHALELGLRATEKQNTALAWVWSLLEFLHLIYVGPGIGATNLFKESIK